MRVWLLAVLCVLFSWQAHAAQKPYVARIALVSDTHIGAEKRGAEYAEHLARVIPQVNASNVDVVLISGDLTEGGTIEQMRLFKKEIKAFKAPVLFVPGNHDVGNKIFSTIDHRVTAEKVQQFEKTLGPSFFVTQRSGVRIIGINSSLLGSGLPREKAMWSFLERELDHPNKKPTVLFCHYAPFIKAFDEPGGIYWNIEPEPREHLLALLKRGGVNTMLTGHLHRPLVNHHDGILFASGLPVSFGIPAKQSPGWTLVTIPRQGEATVEFKEINSTEVPKSK